MHHDITEVDPNSESHLTGERQLIVARSERGLNVGCAPHRFHRATELRQDRIPGRIENASAMRSHQRLEYLLVTSKCFQRPFFILAHQTAEFGNVRLNNGRQLALQGLRTWVVEVVGHAGNSTLRFCAYDSTGVTRHGM